jgi:polynucleotide 5'-kinase involved in rRNA processing
LNALKRQPGRTKNRHEKRKQTTGDDTDKQIHRQRREARESREWTRKRDLSKRKIIRVNSRDSWAVRFFCLIRVHS